MLHTFTKYVIIYNMVNESWFSSGQAASTVKFACFTIQCPSAIMKL